MTGAHVTEAAPSLECSFQGVNREEVREKVWKPKWGKSDCTMAMTGDWTGLGSETELKSHVLSSCHYVTRKQFMGLVCRQDKALGTVVKLSTRSSALGTVDLHVTEESSALMWLMKKTCCSIIQRWPLLSAWSFADSPLLTQKLGQWNSGQGWNPRHRDTRGLIHVKCSSRCKFHCTMGHFCSYCRFSPMLQ